MIKIDILSNRLIEKWRLRDQFISVLRPFDFYFHPLMLHNKDYSVDDHCIFLFWELLRYYAFVAINNLNGIKSQAGQKSD